MPYASCAQKGQNKKQIHGNQEDEREVCVLSFFIVA